MTIATHTIGDTPASLFKETQAMASSAKTLSLDNHSGLDNYLDISNRADRLGGNISIAIPGKPVEEAGNGFRDRPGRTDIYHVKPYHPEPSRPYPAPLHNMGFSTKTNTPGNPTARWAHSRV
jgi:hypothetical protein